MVVRTPGALAWMEVTRDGSTEEGSTDEVVVDIPTTGWELEISRGGIPCGSSLSSISSGRSAVRSS